MKVHYLKTWLSYFEALYAGDKTFDLRQDDRGFQVGDVLVLEEWDEIMDRYTGRQLARRVSHILRAGQCDFYGLRPGFAVLSFKASGIQPPPFREGDVVEMAAPQVIAGPFTWIPGGIVTGVTGLDDFANYYFFRVRHHDGAEFGASQPILRLAPAQPTRSGRNAEE